jgi:hypothetical protein
VERETIGLICIPFVAAGHVLPVKSLVARPDAFDIGEYLGLTLETVSRTLAHLQATAAIEVHVRQIMLRDCSALRRLNA